MKHSFSLLFSVLAAVLVGTPSAASADAGPAPAALHLYVGQAHVLEIAVHGRMHGHRPDAQTVAGAQHAQGDFAAVGDEYLAEHGAS